MLQQRASVTVTPRRLPPLGSIGRGVAFAAVASLCLAAAAAGGAAPRGSQGPEAVPAEPAAAASAESVRALLGRYCLTCHSDRGHAAGLVPVS